MTYVRKKHIAWAMLTMLVPKTIMAYKLGLLKAPKIPDEIEKRITDASEEKWSKIRG